MTVMSESQKALVEQVYSVVQSAPGPINATYAAKQLSLGTGRKVGIALAFKYLVRNKKVIKTGERRSAVYRLPAVAGFTPTVKSTSAKASASLTPVTMVEVPRCTLKLLVKHILASGPVEGELQRAVMQCVEKVL